jgi:hypothetical protein
VTLTGRRACNLAKLVIASTALAVMQVSRHADLGAIGPFPDLYEPFWFPEKLLAAFAEGGPGCLHRSSSLPDPEAPSQSN